MNFKMAMDLVKKAEPTRTITACCDYDGDHYVVTALSDPSKFGENDPFFAVNKKTGEVTEFTPGADIPKFSEAMSKRLVYLAKG